jgi:hypothetical protein
LKAKLSKKPAVIAAAAAVVVVPNAEALGGRIQFASQHPNISLQYYFST